MKPILIVISYEKNVFEYGILQENNYEVYKNKIELLDRELLQLLENAFKKNDLVGIAVCAESLGGFVSSRLILISLNIIAWNNDIPIIKISNSDLTQTERKEKIKSKIVVEEKFTKQVLPVYRMPPDISKSKKKNKFTIN